MIGDEWWRPLPRGFPADALRVLAGLILVPFAPNLAIAIGLLLARNALSQMDVPTRTSYVMTAVTPEERPAAAGITAVPRSLASAASPILAGSRPRSIM